MYDFEEYHQCHFCGEYVDIAGLDAQGKRHFLSDCRPDLVEHEIGELCTWAFQRSNPDFPENSTCYAYQTNKGTEIDQAWTDEHKHFYKDGPM